MKITKREIIASVVIISVMLIIGCLIVGRMTDLQNDRNAEYYKAIQIDDANLFEYGIRTGAGNAFVYGDLEAVDPVTFDELDGEYVWVRKIEEHHNRHTKQVRHTRTVNGKIKTYYTTEVYYSWDYYDSWEKHSNMILFCGHEFEYSKIDLPYSEYVETQNQSSSVRFQYYGVSAQHTGTLYTKLADNTISEQSRFFKDCSIEDALEECTSEFYIGVFWFVWVVLVLAIVVGFYYLDNRWLEG